MGKFCEYMLCWEPFYKILNFDYFNRIKKIFSVIFVFIFIQLAIEPDNPYVFLSCGEDGSVLEIDLREDMPQRNK